MVGSMSASMRSSALRDASQLRSDSSISAKRAASCVRHRSDSVMYSANSASSSCLKPYGSGRPRIVATLFTMAGLAASLNSRLMFDSLNPACWASFRRFHPLACSSLRTSVSHAGETRGTLDRSSLGDGVSSCAMVDNLTPAPVVLPTLDDFRLTKTCRILQVRLHDDHSAARDRNAPRDRSEHSHGAKASETQAF